jgi:hypothetical protein
MISLTVFSKSGIFELSALLTINPPGSTTISPKSLFFHDLTLMFSDVKSIKPAQKFDYSMEYKTINTFELLQLLRYSLSF